MDSQNTAKKRRIEGTDNKDSRNFPMQMKSRTNLYSYQQQSSSEDSIFNCPSVARNLAAPTGFNSGRSSEIFNQRNHQIFDQFMISKNL